MVSLDPMRDGCAGCGKPPPPGPPGKPGWLCVSCIERRAHEVRLRKQGAADLCDRLCKRLENQDDPLNMGDIRHEFAMYVNGRP